jgi:hypothetical protein
LPAYSAGLGYIRIESFHAREQLTAEFDRALEELARHAGPSGSTSATTTGRFGQSQIVGWFLDKPRLAGIASIKNGAPTRTWHGATRCSVPLARGSTVSQSRCWTTT